MPVDRRNFLTTAGAATVFTLAGGSPQIRASQLTGQIGVGFIGSGIRGYELINGFQYAPAARPVAVCDLYDGCLARAKEQIGKEIVTTKDYRAVLDRKDIDAVVIAVPDHLHKRITLDALAAGKHVYVEKPLTWSLEEGPEIIAAEKASGKILQVGSQGKTAALTAKAREIVASGALGKISMVRLANHRNNAQGAWRYEIPPDASEQTIDWPRFLGDRRARAFQPEVFFRWRCWWEFSGGVATDLFVHLLTWLHEVMNVKAPVSVASFGGLLKWKDGRDTPDFMNSLFEYQEGFLADMYVNLNNGWRETRGSTIMGDLGTLLIEDSGKLIFYPDPVDVGVQGYGTQNWPKAMREAYFVSKGWQANGQPLRGGPPPVKPTEIKVEPVPSHQEIFIQTILDGKPSRENATEGHYAAGAAHVANRAYREGKRLKWDYLTNTVSAA
jgi:predicted dehydrogenase